MRSAYGLKKETRDRCEAKTSETVVLTEGYRVVSHLAGNESPKNHLRRSLPQSRFVPFLDCDSRVAFILGA
jgi:hypothetical protein